MVKKRIGYKHGKYVKVPTPHADISKYVTKSGEVEGHFRQKGSTMGKRRKTTPAETRRPKGGWTA